MFTVAIAVLTTGALFLAAGIPFAFAVRRSAEGWIALATDALAFGLVFLTLAITLGAWLGAAGIVLSALVLLAFAGFAVWRRVGFPVRPKRPPLALALLWAVVIVVAILFRLHDSTFLPWVGDMGAYVNWANEFVRTGQLTASWPPIFSISLSISTGIFGTAGTTSAIALNGFAFLAVIARLLNQLHVNRWAVVAMLGAVALNIHAIWYSYFPSSESLNAPIFLVLASLLVTVVRTEKRLILAPVVLTAIVMLNLCLLRGSGSFLLVPAFLVAFASLFLVGWRQWSWRLWAFALAMLVGAEIGVWYGVSVIRKYFVLTQVKYLLPESLYLKAKALGIFTPGPVLLGILLLAAAVVVVFMLVSLRLARKDAAAGLATAPALDSPDALAAVGRAGRATRILALLAGAALTLGVIAEGLVGANIWFILARTGLWVVALAVVTLVFVWRRREVRDDTPLLFFLVATTLMLIAFHTPRLGNDRPHAFFIYWDRYMFSEVIPALIILAGVSLGMGADWLARRVSFVGRSNIQRFGLVGASVLVILLSAVPSIGTLNLLAQDTYMKGAYPFTMQLKSQASTKATMLWGATSSDKAPGFFFVNTWMAFAVPLQRSFGYTFENVHQGGNDFRTDDVITDAQLATAVQAGKPVLVYETQTASGGDLKSRITDPLLTITKKADYTSNISLLSQPDSAGWTHAHIRVVVWKVTASDVLGG